MMRKRLLAVVLCVAMLASLTACSSSGESEKPDTSNNADPSSSEITVMMVNDWIDESTGKGAEFVKTVKQFEENNPGVKITLQGASQQDIKENFQTAALAGGGADVVMMDNSGHAIDMAAMGLLYSLSKITTAEELESQYQPGPLNSGKFEGKYYSIPWYMDSCGLYYNADRLKELNLEVPTTWDELLNAVKVAKEAGYGGITTYQSAYAFYSFFYQNECPVIDTSGETPEVVIDSEAGKEAWNYICELIENDGLVESFKEATTWDKVYESFANGEATFLLGGDWCSSGVEGINPDLNYGIAPMVKEKTQATVLGGWTWNINVNCKNPELAYQLIQYLNSEDSDPILAVEGKISARKDFDYDKALEGKDKLKVFTEEFPYTKARPAVINEKSVDEMITNAILEADYNHIDPDTALQSLSDKINENIQSNYK
ncbi:sugar ABC transporter substrate-binding protein [Anaerobium acetethylicum]|uniref:ABC-type glycerol-3-phosphate transport system, substrate-binding protein n=1 Tax=Anaerobium acetethylicum TaxID=1619234 RepID=A0A1D3TZG9_9FIRM|nr:sugar ABC transporter substrate-binding protein [Anaerobium acetethylicum]SCP99970.1 ABC-type glycerol-3-phosphate transport system, substrate-binding protein [Anaerobium acetethylicum]